MPISRGQVYNAIRAAAARGDDEAVRSLGTYAQTIPLVHVEPEAPEAGPNPITDIGGSLIKGVPDVALSLVRGAVAQPIAGLAGAVSAPFIGANRAANVVNDWSSTIQGEPFSDAGKAGMANVAKPVSYFVDKVADRPGEWVAEKTGSPALGAAVNTGIQAIPALLAPETRGALRSVAKPGVRAIRDVAFEPKPIGGVSNDVPPVTVPKAPPAATIPDPAVAKATAYAGSLGLDWDALSRQMRDNLTRLAASATDLSGLDAEAITRQARADALGYPVTRGQATRNLAQLTREEALVKSEAGQPLMDIMGKQDEVLHGQLNTLRGETGATATTREGVGKSVQGAERYKADVLHGEYGAAYKAAETAGETAQPVNIAPLETFLKQPANARNASWLRSAIDDYLPKDVDGNPVRRGGIDINSLEEIRKEAVAAKQGGGTPGYYAGQAIGVIDDILDASGGDLYKGARTKFKAYNDEFTRQGRVARLVDEKGYTTDRAVALEDTLDHVLKSSAESIGEIKQSLTTGGNAATQLKGSQAWRDIQAGVIDYLKEKAAGKRAIVGEKGQLQFNSAYREAFSELEQDGKIDAIFNPKQAARLREIYDAAGDVRTKPTGRIAGSDSVPRLVALLESFGDKLGTAARAIPGVGDLAAKAVGDAYRARKQVREVATAQGQPLKEAADAAAKRGRRTQSSRDTKAAAPVTLTVSEIAAQGKRR